MLKKIKEVENPRWPPDAIFWPLRSGHNQTHGLIWTSGTSKRVFLAKEVPFVVQDKFYSFDPLKSPKTTIFGPNQFTRKCEWLSSTANCKV